MSLTVRMLTELVSGCAGILCAPRPGEGELGQFPLNDQLHHMIVNNSPAVLSADKSNNGYKPC